MKAISLTCNDEADKTHDLLALYEALPDRSRERICADFPDITDVIRKGRHRFGAWRYFETRVGDAAIRSMVDVEEARALGKAARVILDEAEFVGLAATASIQAKRNVSILGDTNLEKHELKLKLEASRRGSVRCEPALCPITTSFEVSRGNPHSFSSLRLSEPERF